NHAIVFLAKLEAGMDELQKIAEDRKREAVVPKQKELLQYVRGQVSVHCVYVVARKADFTDIKTHSFPDIFNSGERVYY
ncbi:hypothetical protein Tco_1535790, partial [Tanacetum coccineum]